jgi:hypothetical protein
MHTPEISELWREAGNKGGAEKAIKRENPKHFSRLPVSRSHTNCGPGSNSSKGPLSVSPPKPLSIEVRSQAREGVIPIIKELKKQGLLIECSNPYTIPILGVRKRPNKWRLVQDLHLIDEAVIPLHQVVPNPYMLLAQIPPDATYCSALDLKDAFFCIPLHPESQPIFAFEDPTRKVGQVTRTVLPQGFRESPHLFGLALAQNLSE